MFFLLFLLLVIIFCVTNHLLISDSNRERLRAALYSCTEDQKSLFEYIGTEASLTGQVSTASEIENIINSISVQDVTGLVGKVVKGKPAIAAIGHLDNMPYADDLA